MMDNTQELLTLEEARKNVSRAQRANYTAAYDLISSLKAVISLYLKETNTKIVNNAIDVNGNEVDVTELKRASQDNLNKKDNESAEKLIVALREVVQRLDLSKLKSPEAMSGVVQAEKSYKKSQYLLEKAIREFNVASESQYSEVNLDESVANAKKKSDSIPTYRSNPIPVTEPNLKLHYALLGLAVFTVLASAAVLTALYLPEHMPTAIAAIVNNLSPFVREVVFGAAIGAGALGLLATTYEGVNIKNNGRGFFGNNDQLNSAASSDSPSMQL